jgi:hypothetical protein
MLELGYDALTNVPIDLFAGRTMDVIHTVNIQETNPLVNIEESDLVNAISGFQFDDRKQIICKMLPHQTKTIITRESILNGWYNSSDILLDYHELKFYHDLFTERLDILEEEVHFDEMIVLEQQRRAKCDSQRCISRLDLVTMILMGFSYLVAFVFLNILVTVQYYTNAEWSPMLMFGTPCFFAAYNMILDSFFALSTMGRLMLPNLKDEWRMHQTALKLAHITRTGRYPIYPDKGTNLFFILDMICKLRRLLLKPLLAAILCGIPFLFDLSNWKAPLVIWFGVILGIQGLGFLCAVMFKIWELFNPRYGWLRNRIDGINEVEQCRCKPNLICETVFVWSMPSGCLSMVTPFLRHHMWSVLGSHVDY